MKKGLYTKVFQEIIVYSRIHKKHYRALNYCGKVSIEVSANGLSKGPKTRMFLLVTYTS